MHLKTKFYDESEERTIVLEATRPQQSVAKPQITRNQVARFFARRGAVQLALNFKYQGNVSLAQEIENIIIDGEATQYSEISNHRIELRNPNNDDHWIFRRKVEKNYLKVVFDKGEFKRNY
jgi:hypothetical protein